MGFAWGVLYNSVDSDRPGTHLQQTPLQNPDLEEGLVKLVFFLKGQI